MAKCMNGELKVGQKIAYATRQGSSLDMTIGEVKAVKTRKDRWSKEEREYILVKRLKTTSYYQPNSDAKLVPITTLDRVVIMNEPEPISVPVDDLEVCS